MAPLAETGDALEGQATSVRCPYEQAKKHQRVSRGSAKGWQFPKRKKPQIPACPGPARRGREQHAGSRSLPWLRPGAARCSPARASGSSGRLLLLPSGNAAAPQSPRPAGTPRSLGPRVFREAWSPSQGGAGSAAGSPPVSLQAGTARTRGDRRDGMPSRRRVQHPATHPVPAEQPKC